MFKRLLNHGFWVVFNIRGTGLSMMVSPCFSFPKMFHCHIKLREGTPLRRLDKADGSKMAKLMVQSHRWVLVEYPEYPWRTKGWPLVQLTVPWWVRLKIEYPLVHHVPHYFMALAGMYTPCSDRPTTHITIIYIYILYRYIFKTMMFSYFI